MHRQPLLQLLREYRATWPAESATTDRFIHFVETHPTCFERSLAIGHVTGSAWIVDGPGQRTLLTHHRKLDKWLQCGGHADGESAVLQVALREAWEETGLEVHPLLDGRIFDLDIHPIPARGTEPEHFHYDVRFACRSPIAEYQVSDESHDLAWVELAHLSDYTREPSMLRMAGKWASVPPTARALSS